uniref:Uncharacterized protein n=1 Tax=Arundo donax TaxID=35708 RepID=A0A0A9B2N3_ARUDO
MNRRESLARAGRVLALGGLVQQAHKISVGWIHFHCDLQNVELL